MRTSSLLVVDQEPEGLRAVQQSLRPLRRRWRLRFACGERAGRAAAGRQTFDVIVLAVRPPGRDLLRWLDELRRDGRTSETPVVVLASPEAHEVQRHAIRLGATDLLALPIRREEFLVRLNTVLSLKQRQEEIQALNADLAATVRRRTAELERSRLDVIWRLAKVGEYRDEETGNHIVRVGRYSHLLARRLGVSAGEADLLALAAPLHDIGKVGIPDSILLKPGRLSLRQRARIQTHCVIGANILLQKPRGWPGVLDRPDAGAGDNRIVRMAASIALTHHERWDGQGYPMGLRGMNIPLMARIVAVADVYDALRSARPYKPPYSHEQTLSILATERGRHFDPDIHDAFRTVHDAFRAIRAECEDDPPAANDDRDETPRILPLPVETAET
ncbi:MAG: HD domain-containing protein [Planctomycetes bacterium]|nr:HD domain-containing protein [Planctomycetota bacterium]